MLLQHDRHLAFFVAQELITDTRSHRPTKDTSQNQVLGPGHVLQIDDVDLKVTLVSEHNGLVLGSARCFMATDQWSGCLVGAHDTLAGSGYEGVRELLVNVATPKDRFLIEQRIKKANPAYLPGDGIYAEITADNGPVRSKLGDILPANFASLANVAVYRGDLKPDIESGFHAFLKQAAEKLPGFTRVEQHIGQPPADSSARLTRTQLRAIIWEWMAFYNTRTRNEFLPEAFLHLEFDKRPANTPYELVREGIIHVSGKLRTMPDDQIRRMLLRSRTGTLTGRKGIRFEGLHYFIDDDVPYRFRSEKVEIRYSENYVRQIAVWMKGKEHFASLRPVDDEKFGHLSFPELKLELEATRAKNRPARSLNLRLRVGLNGSIATTDDDGKRNLQARYPDKSLRKHLTNAVGRGAIRNRDRTDERREAGAKDGATFPPKTSNNVPPRLSPLRKKSMHALCEKSPAL